MNCINTTSRLVGVLFVGMFIAGNTNAQIITVPQTAPYTNDAQTVLLQHFDGTISGSANGSVTYTNGIFGQGVHLVVGSWVSWGNFGTLSQGTVEFWGILDTLDYSDNLVTGPAFIQADYSQFYASTFSTSIQSTNYAISIYHCGCALPDNWVGMPNTIETPAFSVTSNTWHHFATTWGSQGFHFYIDGNLVYTNANTEGLNGNTAFWAIGGLVDGGTDSSPGFTGAIDELRISNFGELAKLDKLQRRIHRHQ